VLTVCIVAAVWLAGSAASPALEAAGQHRAAAWTRLPYAPLCHQIEGRCFAVAGGPLSLCARCSGLYVGGLAGLLAGAALGAWRRRWPVWVFFAGLAPTGVQWISVRMGLPDPGVLARFALSLPAGFVCGWFLAHALGDLAEGAADVSSRGVARARGARPGL
jgi:uncharacterized membrane protein